MRKTLSYEKRRRLETVLAFIMYKEAAEKNLEREFMAGDTFYYPIHCDTNICEIGRITPMIRESDILSGSSDILYGSDVFGVKHVEDVFDTKAFKKTGITTKDFYKLYREWGKILECAAKRKADSMKKLKPNKMNFNPFGGMVLGVKVVTTTIELSYLTYMRHQDTTNHEEERGRTIQDTPFQDLSKDDQHSTKSNSTRQIHHGRDLPTPWDNL